MLLEALTKLLPWFSFCSDAFCLFYDAKARTVKAMNGSGRAPEKLSIEYLHSRGISEGIPTTDLNSVTVPGSCDLVLGGLHRAYF